MTEHKYKLMWTDLVIKDIEDKLKFVYIGTEVKYFIGGSQRFGWNKKDSDIDIFMYIPNNLLDRAGKYLISNGFVKNTDKHKEYEMEFIQFKDPFGIVDLNITENEYYFSDLQKEHDKIEKFLSKRPIVRGVLSQIKNKYDIKGRDIYRLLRLLISKRRIEWAK